MINLTPELLDDLYTELCHALTEVGAAQTPAMLARFALLMMHESGDAEAIRRAIRDAAGHRST